MVDLIQQFIGWDTNNKYEINNANGQKIFFAAEGKDAK